MIDSRKGAFKGLLVPPAKTVSVSGPGLHEPSIVCVAEIKIVSVVGACESVVVVPAFAGSVELAGTVGCNAQVHSQDSCGGVHCPYQEKTNNLVIENRTYAKRHVPVEMSLRR